MINETARNLITENHNLIFYMLHKYNLDIDEYYGDAAIGLIMAANTFDSNKGIKFATYATKCIFNEIMKNKRKRRINTISIDGPILNGNSNGDEEIKLSDTISSNESLEDNICNSDLLSQIFNSLNDPNCKKIHKDIFEDYFINELSQVEIASKYNKSQPQISRILKLMRNEFIKLINQ